MPRSVDSWDFSAEFNGILWQHTFAIELRISNNRPPMPEENLRTIVKGTLKLALGTSLWNHLSSLQQHNQGSHLQATSLTHALLC